MQLNYRHIELFRAAQSGDMYSLGVLLELYRPSLYAVALRLLGFGQPAHDAVQETFIIAIIHIQKIREASALGSWLNRVLYNYCMMQKRNERKLSYRSMFTAKEIESLWMEDPERLLENIVNEQKIRAAISLLPEPLRLVVLLRYFSRFIPMT
jgi:RNA polymerase sigma factor (sigma-70 family)